MKTSLTLFTLFIGSTQLFADNKPSASFDVVFSAGSRYDSQLALEDIDKVNREGDSASILKAELNSQFTPVNNLKLNIDFNQSNKQYQQFSEYDTQIQQLALGAKYDFDWINAGITQHTIAVDVDGNHFLDIKRTGISLSRLFDHQWYVRIESVYQDKSFDNNQDRNAKSQNLMGSLYYFFNQGKNYWSLGTSQDNEDARLNYYDATGHTYNATYSHAITLFEYSGSLKLNWQKQVLNYEGFNPEVLGQRKDNKLTYALEGELKITQSFSIHSGLQFNRFDSNLKSADYDAEKVELLLTINW